MKIFSRVVWLVLFLSLASPAFAAELRIIDHAGLTRAVRTIENEAGVRVELRDREMARPGEAALAHVDAFYPEIRPEVENSTLIFRNVPAGTWIISIREGDDAVLRVRIE